jgi:periplasmic divalent cation tolerance protein
MTQKKHGSNIGNHPELREDGSQMDHMASQTHLILVTAPDLKTARELVTFALKQRYVACGNIIPKVESHYWWQGKLECSQECLIIFKSTEPMLAPLKALILEKHPYDVPEFVSLEIHSGSHPYLEWIKTESRGPVGSPQA